MAAKSPMTSRLPGRLRLRARELRQTRRNGALCEELRGWNGVVSVEGNPATGGILLCYDAGRVDQAAMEARLADHLATMLESGQTSSSTIPEKEAGTIPEKEAGLTLWRMNRYAKLGMLGSLTGTLLALAVGKKLHAALGALHLAFLMVHLANHRTKLAQ